ncbi:unnamed protein product [Choristocarpus tenellus]
MGQAFVLADVKDIYVELPEDVAGASGLVGKLKRSLYGLVQASHSWKLKLVGTLRGLGFEQGETGPCLHLVETG